MLVLHSHWRMSDPFPVKLKSDFFDALSTNLQFTLKKVIHYFSKRDGD